MHVRVFPFLVCWLVQKNEKKIICKFCCGDFTADPKIKTKQQFISPLTFPHCLWTCRSYGWFSLLLKRSVWFICFYNLCTVPFFLATPALWKVCVISHMHIDWTREGYFKSSAKNLDVLKHSGKLFVCSSSTCTIYYLCRFTIFVPLVDCAKTNTMCHSACLVTGIKLKINSIQLPNELINNVAQLLFW